jgi:5,10-methylenetetrahydromethanopterin reductase
MKFSYCTIPNRSTKTLVDIALKSEQAGVDLLWIPDEEFYRDPFAVLAAIGAKTTKISLGLGITNPYTRHPVQVARAMATVQDYRDEPVIVGIGAGLKHTRAALAAPDGKFVDVTRDAIIAMKRLFAGESVSVANSVFRIEDARLHFLPHVTPKIYVASTHPDAFRMAGEVADGVIVGNVGEPEAMREVIRFVEEGLKASGRKREDVTIVAWNMVLQGDNVDQLADIIREMIARTITASHSKIRTLLGLDPAQVETIVARVKAKQFPIERELVPNDLVAKMAILGSAEECTRRLAALHEAGADMVGVRPAGAILKALDYEGNVLGLHDVFKSVMKG